MNHCLLIQTPRPSPELTHPSMIKRTEVEDTLRDVNEINNFLARVKDNNKSINSEMDSIMKKLQIEG